eukprot:TRINITY_DN6949_c0_g1_i2.p1 TRINITY_DN6949_c0_g1~~TRINITY_DN6949_c0_g1_i2.p1  ORF type:complete len:241 (+),score=35.32 TRINITY_DN6949_c0_g1_i2:207-929(+)
MMVVAATTLDKLPPDCLVRPFQDLSWFEWTVLRNTSRGLRCFMETQFTLPKSLDPGAELLPFKHKNTFIVPSLMRFWASGCSGRLFKNNEHRRLQGACLCMQARLMCENGDSASGLRMMQRIGTLPGLRSARKHPTDDQTALLMARVSFEVGTAMYRSYNPDLQGVSSNLQLAARCELLPLELRRQAAAQLAFALADTPADAMNAQKQRAQILDTLEFAVSLGEQSCLKELGLRLRTGLY